MKKTHATLRRKVADLLDDSNQSWASRAVDGLIIATIILTIITIMLESIPSLHPAYTEIFYIVEVFSLIIFGSEYILRVWSAPDSPAGAGYTVQQSRLRYVRSPLAIIDLLAILPFILSLFSLDLRFLRVLRLLRILKLTRYSSAMNTLLKVIKNESRSFFSVVIVLVIILIIASSCIYLLEHEAQPETFGSIPESMWWTMVTLATVGYGDAIPITPWGKLFGGIIMLVGVGLVALPAGILASAFSEQLHKNKKDYRSAVRKALRDGIISPAEYAELQKLQEEYNLSPEDAEEIIRNQSFSHKTPASKQCVCPNCGEQFNLDQQSS